MPMWTVELIVMLVMIGLNGVFAGYEIALASVSRPGWRPWSARTARGPRLRSK